jgi:hypothetical protein
MHVQSCVLRPIILACMGLLAACAPADDDACESGLECAVIVPDCSRQGDFIVELGEGLEGFEPIAADGEPTLHYGAQGGTHLILAARLVTPDPLDKYEVSLLAEAGQQPCTRGECASYVTIGQIAQTIEGASRVQVGAGEAELPNLYLVVENWTDAPARRLTIEISDACDRQATNVRTFTSN